MNYMLSMNFISWIIALFMIVGFMVIKVCEKHVDDEDDSYSVIIKDYNIRSWSGRVFFVISLGASIISMAVTSPFQKFLKKGD
jgi:hypothetical protein